MNLLSGELMENIILLQFAKNKWPPEDSPL
jgi:hypothetical protein